MTAEVATERARDQAETLLLSVRDLRVDLSGPAGVVHAVGGVSFDVSRGETFGIVGESGCGKSTTALSLVGLLPSDGARVSGSISYDGAELTGMTRRQMQDVRGRAIGFVFQDPMSSLNPTMRIGRQVAEPLRRHLGYDRASALHRARELLDEVQIPQAASWMRAYPNELSGGMRQRVMIAIAIACGPQLLIADEPTTALDVTTQLGVLMLIEKLQVAHGMSLVIISHDMGVVSRLAERVAVMYAGQFVEMAPAKDLFARPEHPYTAALLAASPQVDGDDARERRLAAIPGEPPDLTTVATGCRYAPRCEHANRPDGCASSAQDLREIRAGHWVRTAHPASGDVPWTWR